MRPDLIVITWPRCGTCEHFDRTCLHGAHGVCTVRPLTADTLARAVVHDTHGCADWSPRRG